jgi:hypothetical protein
LYGTIFAFDPKRQPVLYSVFFSGAQQLNPAPSFSGNRNSLSRHRVQRLRADPKLERFKDNSPPNWQYALESSTFEPFPISTKKKARKIGPH